MKNKCDYIKLLEPSKEELEYRQQQYKDVKEVLSSRLQCTCCLKDVKNKTFLKHELYIHPILKVLTCRECNYFYGDGIFSEDEDGSEKFCKWCGQGGTLYLCSECPCSFCKACIKRNMARSIRTKVENEDWKCFVCNPEPLYELRALAWALKQVINSHQNNKHNKIYEISNLDSYEGQINNSLIFMISFIKSVQKVCFSLNKRIGHLSQTKCHSRDELMNLHNQILLTIKSSIKRFNEISENFINEWDVKEKLIKTKEEEIECAKKVNEKTESREAVGLIGNLKPVLNEKYGIMSTCDKEICENKTTEKVEESSNSSCLPSEEKPLLRVRKVEEVNRVLLDHSKANIQEHTGGLKCSSSENKSDETLENSESKCDKTDEESSTGNSKSIIDSEKNGGPEKSVPNISSDKHTEGSVYCNVENEQIEQIENPTEPKNCNKNSDHRLVLENCEPKCCDKGNETETMAFKCKESDIMNEDLEPEVCDKQRELGELEEQSVIRNQGNEGSEECAVGECEQRKIHENIEVAGKEGEQKKTDTDALVIQSDKTNDGQAESASPEFLNKVTQGKNTNERVAEDASPECLNKETEDNNINEGATEGASPHCLNKETQGKNTTEDASPECLNKETQGNNINEGATEDASPECLNKETQDKNTNETVAKDASSECLNKETQDSNTNEGATEVASPECFKKETQGSKTECSNSNLHVRNIILSEIDKISNEGEILDSASNINDSELDYTDSSDQSTSDSSGSSNIILTSSEESDSDKYTEKAKPKRIILSHSDLENTETNNESAPQELVKGLMSTDESVTSSSEMSSSIKSTPRKKICITKDKRNLKEKTNKDNVNNISKEIDSDDEINKLCNLNSLFRKRKVISSSSDNSISGENKNVKYPLTKKKKEAEISLVDFEGSSSDNSRDRMKSEIADIVSVLPFYTSYDVAEALQKPLTPTDNEISTSNISLSDSDRSVQKVKKKRIKSTKKSKCISNLSSSDSDAILKYEARKKRNAWRSDKLLRIKLSDSSSDSSRQSKKYTSKSSEIVISSEKESLDSENESSDSENESSDLVKSSSDMSNQSGSLSESKESMIKLDTSSSESSSDGKEKKSSKRVRRRASSKSSSGSSVEIIDTPFNKGHRKNIRKVLKEENLLESTQTALKEEQERKKRIAERQKIYNDILNHMQPIDKDKVEKLVLDFDLKTKEELVSVNKSLVSKLKPHQAEGIKFMWDCCFETLKSAMEKQPGSGCILAHCMGLGKTLQVVALCHTLLAHKDIPVKTVLVLCPLSTVLNWANEFSKWLKGLGGSDNMKVYHFSKSTASHRCSQLKEWKRRGGIFLIGYNLFRTLTNQSNKAKAIHKAAYLECLINPGPDLVICDEGHVLKNENTALSKSVSKIKTLRRIVLTGTPLQNNLIEYHCMVQFVKPNLLGTKKEFTNRFVNPINNGQFVDSTAHDVKVMKRRAHVLHNMLDGVIQRKAYSVLVPFLPPKFEYVLGLSLTDLQCQLYKFYLENFSRKKETGLGVPLFKDRNMLMLICAHPRLLRIQKEIVTMKKGLFDEDKSSKDIDINDDKSTTSSSSSNDSVLLISSDDEKTNKSLELNEIQNEEQNVLENTKTQEWWSDILTEEQMEDITSSSKLLLFFNILSKCEEIGDKLLVFSQSLLVLDLIEHFLDKIDSQSFCENPPPELAGFKGCWIKGQDYFRMDGSSSLENRTLWCKKFNDVNNKVRLFLISTRAGGMGINLTGANRVIIFDASWNPSYDVQSIFRIYRFGQEKPCYVYRFLSKGTIEQKVYDRQIAKLSMSCRVVDEQQIDRHFSNADLNELYNFCPNEKDSSTPVLPRDRLMAELLKECGNLILSYHTHDSMLENQEDEELTEEERQAAWKDFENEKTPPPIKNQTNDFYSNIYSKLKHVNPTWSEMELTKATETLIAKWLPQYQITGQNVAPARISGNASQLVAPSRTNVITSAGLARTSGTNSQIFAPVRQSEVTPQSAKFRPINPDLGTFGFNRLNINVPQRAPVGNATKLTSLPEPRLRDFIFSPNIANQSANSTSQNVNLPQNKNISQNASKIVTPLQTLHNSITSPINIDDN